MSGIKKIRGGPSENKKITPGHNIISSTTKSALNTLKGTDKPTKTIKDSPSEIITDEGRIHDFCGRNIFQAKINDKYRLMLYADTNEKIYLNGSTDEYIVDSFGRGTNIGGKKLKFVQTNKTIDKADKKNKWIIIDENTLEKITLYLKDDPEEYITNRLGQGSLMGKNIQGVWTNKSNDEIVLIDTDTLEKITLHLKGDLEEVVNHLGEHVITYTLGGRSAIYVPMDNKKFIVYSDTGEKVTIKDNPEEYITDRIYNLSGNNNFETLFKGRKTGKFEINNDENNCVILYLDTLEKVTLKDRPQDIITNYTNYIKYRDSSEERKISLGGRDVVLVNINNNNKTVAIYADTLEKVTLKDYPQDIITGIYISGYRHERKIEVQINNSKIIEIDPETILQKKQKVKEVVIVT